MQNYPHLLAPLKIKNTTFRNRMFASPVTVRNLNDGDTFSQEAILEYGMRAQGGFAEVTVTETYVDFDYAGRGINPIDLVSPGAMKNRMRVEALTNAIKSHGAVASIQFNHMGNVNHPDTCHGRNPIGPSHMIRPDGVEIDEMDEEMMERVADNFAHACFNARQFGFDMVMLHGGHGWLLSQFISPLSNRRTDKWGGSIENRARFPLLVLDRIRKAVGDDFLIEYRLSGDERTPGGLTIDEATEFCKIIQDKVDLLHVTAGLYHSHVESKSFSSMFEKHGCNVGLAAQIKRNVHIPVVSVGGFNDPELMERVIAEGLCDAVAMGRQQIADPYLPYKIISGQEDEINPCLRCSCFNPMPSDPKERSIPGRRAVACTVNPRAYRTMELAMAPKPTRSYDVLVVGGGAAGMYAAFTAAERGHRVTLAEKSDRLGGVLWFADDSADKADLKKFRDSLVTRTCRRGVNVELNCTVTPAYIEQKKPDCVICCVGADPVVPKIPGIELAHHALYAYSDFGRLGERIVVIGGGLIGCEEALHLAKLGKQVTVVELMDSLARDAYSSHRTALRLKMDGLVTAMTGAACTEITERGVRIRTADGEQFLECDTVLYAVGMRARTDEVEKLRGACRWFVVCGDARRAGTVEAAVCDGFNAAMDLL